MDQGNLHEYMEVHPELKEPERIKFVSRMYSAIDIVSQALWALQLVHIANALSYSE